MRTRHRPRALRSAGGLAVRLLLAVTMVAGALTVSVAEAEPAWADTIVRSPDGRFITATSDRMHDLEVHVTVEIWISRNGDWQLSVYAHNTARTRKFVHAGAVVRSPATGVVLDVGIRRAKIGVESWDEWYEWGDSLDLGIHGDEVFADPDLSFELWMDARRL